MSIPNPITSYSLQAGIWRWLKLADAKGLRGFVIGIGADITLLKSQMRPSGKADPVTVGQSREI